jgi:hypothetical protein
MMPSSSAISHYAFFEDAAELSPRFSLLFRLLQPLRHFLPPQPLSAEDISFSLR